MPTEDDTSRIPIRKLHQEEGAEELVDSPDMEPYLNFAMALMRGLTRLPNLMRFGNCLWKSVMFGG
jgi:hypothetical protein